GDDPPRGARGGGPHAGRGGTRGPGGARPGLEPDRARRRGTRGRPAAGRGERAGGRGRDGGRRAGGRARRGGAQEGGPDPGVAGLRTVRRTAGGPRTATPRPSAPGSAG